MESNTNLMPVASMHEIAEAGALIAQSGLCGARNPAEGFVVALTCQQRGMDVLTFSETYHVMMGRVTKRSDAMLADFLRSGGEHQIIERSANRAAIALHPPNAEPQTFELTWDEACAEPFVYAGNPAQAAAELKKPQAERRFKDKYATPRSRMQMLWARVVSDAVRAVDPRANQGSYTPEEIGDVIDDRTIDITPGPPVTPPMPATAADGVDYSICPIADEGCQYTGTYWSEMPIADLHIALTLDHPALTDGHRAAIKHTIQTIEAAQ